MNSFEMGHHVMAEVADAEGNLRKVGGYLMDTPSEGIVLKVTHKECAVTRVVSEGTRADFRRQLQEKSMRKLRVASVLCGHPRWLLFGREQLVDAMLLEVEQEFLASKDDGVQLREMTEPILTFISHNVLSSIELTEDKIHDAEMSLFDQTLDGTLKKILDEGLTEEPTDGTIEE